MYIHKGQLCSCGTRYHISGNTAYCAGCKTIHFVKQVTQDKYKIQTIEEKYNDMELLNPETLEKHTHIHKFVLDNVNTIYEIAEAKTCSICGTETDDCVEIDGNNVCFSCRGMCDGCETDFINDDLTDVDGFKLCTDCKHNAEQDSNPYDRYGVDRQIFL